MADEKANCSAHDNEHAEAWLAHQESEAEGRQDIGIERRHSRWYEVLLFSTMVQLLLGLLVVAALPAVLRWGPAVWRYWAQVRFNTLCAVVAAFVLALILLKRLGRFSGGTRLAAIGPTVTGAFFLAFAVVLFGRVPYTRSVLLTGYLLSLAWFYGGHFLGRRYCQLKVAALPSARCRALESTPNIEVRHLQEPNLGGVRFDAVVADLHSDELGPEWQRFLAECILAKLPVHHVRRMHEAMTGRVQIDRLSENDVGALLPSPNYSVIKRLIDVFGVLLVTPIVLPVMLLVALAIRLDSPGPALFVQNRVGQGDRDFRIYKFRSMRANAESAGAQLAAVDDTRITRVGHFIRKTRLDELPQLWNVIKGDMSLIGPRPEQRKFVDQFDKEIPFYIYRHVVKPGITGWAQVTQGYAGNAEETRIKIEHDFYYIKHFSLWLDVLIVLKTLRVILTGWGAR